jgi:hypothetical protein
MKTLSVLKGHYDDILVFCYVLAVVRKVIAGSNTEAYSGVSLTKQVGFGILASSINPYQNSFCILPNLRLCPDI